ncbi:MAG: CatB-related O-acetyltransferase [Desulfobacter sp.]|nr:MAG: CatB-related O-acetyltransferase [Desulfobacter sp.]
MIERAWGNLAFDFRRRVYISRLLKKYRNRHVWIGRNCFFKRCELGDWNRIYENCRLVYVSLGDRTYISEHCAMFDVAFGKFCAVGPRVTIGLGMHPSRKFVSIHPLFYSRTNSACPVPFTDKNYFVEHRPVTVGHDVWIGANAVVLDGVTIGNGAVVGAGAVVTRDVPPYGVVAGVPAKIQRFRFEQDEIEYLQAFCWWDREPSWLEKNWRSFHDIKALMKKYPISGLGKERAV